MALVAAFFTLALASCSKDDISSDTDLVVSPPADSEAPSYYAITDAEGIGFTKDGIAYEYISNGKTRWVLSYQEIAKRLDIDISKISTIKIPEEIEILQQFPLTGSGKIAKEELKKIAAEHTRFS